MATQQTASTKIVTGKVRLSYVNIFKKNDKDKYSLAILIPKSDKATIDKIKGAVDVVKTDAKSTSTWGGKFLANFKLPLRDGDTDRDVEKSPEYKGHYFINCNSNQRPGVIDVDKVEIMDAEEVYSGCYGRVSVNFYAYSVDGNKGIACGLNNVQKLADGEPLSGRSRAEDDFSDEVEDFLK
jgi:hypothetical protein